MNTSFYSSFDTAVGRENRARGAVAGKVTKRSSRRRLKLTRLKRRAKQKRKLTQALFENGVLNLGGGKNNSEIRSKRCSCSRIPLIISFFLVGGESTVVATRAHATRPLLLESPTKGEEEEELDDDVGLGDADFEGGYLDVRFFSTLVRL